VVFILSFYSQGSNIQSWSDNNFWSSKSTNCDEFHVYHLATFNFWHYWLVLQCLLSTLIPYGIIYVYICTLFCWILKPTLHLQPVPLKQADKFIQMACIIYLRRHWWVTGASLFFKGICGTLTYNAQLWCESSAHESLHVEKRGPLSWGAQHCWMVS